MPAPSSIVPAELGSLRLQGLRFVPLLIGATAMASGLWAGLVRLGLDLPSTPGDLVQSHGPLMICGFLGTLISLERAVALGVGWGYVAPALSSLGTVALLMGAVHAGAAAFLAAAAALWLASVALAARQVALFTVVLALAPGCWVIGTLAWLLGLAPPAGWWLTFLILTVAAERLELSRMAQPPRSSQVLFGGVVLLLLIGCVRGELAAEAAPFAAGGLLAASAWLIRYDIARRTVRLSGQPRFSACAILVGHAWLGVAGVLLAFLPLAAGALVYDAVVHAIAIGFVLSMVLGHAPIILPAVTGIRVRYSAWAFVPLIILQAAVVARVAGDLIPAQDVRAASGLLTVVALAGYVATLAIASRRRTDGR